MYNNYEFDKDVNWIKYSKSIDKTISKERYEYVKQLWFQQNVNKKQQMNNQCVEKFKEESKMPQYLYSTENILKLLFMGLLFLRDQDGMIGLLFCTLALIRQYRNTKGATYRFILHNEFLHNIVYLMIVSSIENVQNIVTFSPILLHAWVGICEFIHTNHVNIYEKIKGVNDKTRLHKQQILLQKNQMEILLVVIYLIAKLFDIGNWVLIILHICFLKFKYAVNDRSRNAWKSIDVWIVKQLPKYLIPLYGHLKYMGVYVFTQ